MSLSQQPRRSASALIRTRKLTHLRSRRLLTTIERLEPRVVLAGDTVESGWMQTPVEPVNTGDEITLFGGFNTTPEDPINPALTVDVNWSIYKDYTWAYDPAAGTFYIESQDPDGNFDTDFQGNILEKLLTTIDPAQVTTIKDAASGYHDTSAVYTPSVGGNFHVVLTVTSLSNPAIAWQELGQLTVNSVGLEVSIDPITGPLAEGTTIPLSATVEGSLTLAYVWEVYEVIDDQSGETPVAFSFDPTFNFTPTDDGEYEIRLTIEDTNSGTTESAITSIVVDNVAPEIDSLSGPGVALPGFPITFNGVASGASVDTITTSWEIRNAANVVVASGSDSEIDYTPTVTGAYTVTFSATDDDGTVVSQVANLTVQNYLQVGDVLTIAASAGGSSVGVSAVVGGLELTINGAASPVLSGVTSLVILGQDGNDTFVITGNIHVPVTIDAGAGNDTILIGPGVTSQVIALGGLGNDLLIGGSGNNILVGGAGNDTITGGGQRDLLIGGDGVDILLGNSQDDILIAGWTNHDNSPETLEDILDMWLEPTSFQARVASLASLLNSSTVHDDGDIDILLGLGGTDWFLANRVGGSLLTRDLLLDANGNEINNRLEL